MAWKYLILRTAAKDLPFIFPAECDAQDMSDALLEHIAPDYPEVAYLSTGLIDDVAGIDFRASPQDLGLFRESTDELIINDFLEKGGVR